MFYVKVDPDGFIEGIEEGSILPEGAFELNPDIISNCDIVKGEHISLYNKDTWKYFKAKIDRILYKNLKGTSEDNALLDDYTILYKKSSNCRLNYNKYYQGGKLISLGFVCCDKDVDLCIDTIKSIVDASALIEIIVVCNCEYSKPVFPSGVKVIYNNKNLYPFTARSQIAEVASSTYLWYVDGDDKADIKSALEYLDTMDSFSDIVIFGVKDKLPSIKRCDDFITEIYKFPSIDFTLHNVLFKQTIYKNFLSLPKQPIWYFEDSFIFLYAAQFANTLTLSKYDVYDYNRTNGGFLWKLYSDESISKMLGGTSILLDLVDKYFTSENASKIKSHLVNAITCFCDTNTFHQLDKSFIKYIPYYTDKLKLNKNFYDQLTQYDNNLPLDVIYIFYGKNYSEEIQRLKKDLPNITNIITIDFFNVLKDGPTIIKTENIKEALNKAMPLIKSDNIAILESYKCFYPLNENMVKNKTTVFSNGKDFIDEVNPLLRNNIVFKKVDLEKFLYFAPASLGSLSSAVESFVRTIDIDIIESRLTKAIPFDESDITFNFMNFNDLLSRDVTSQVCVEDLRKKFPKSTIKVLTEADLSEEIESSQVTKDFISKRDNKQLLNYENDILRLIIQQNTPKSVYLDMDAIIQDKNEFLLQISMYPNFCPATSHNKYYVFHNETMWTLGKSEFIQANLEFYNNISSETIANNSNLFWNGAVSLQLQNLYGSNIYPHYIQTLDMAGSFDSEYIIHHFCGSRLNIKYVENPRKVGIIFGFNEVESYVNRRFNLECYQDVDAVFVIGCGSVNDMPWCHSANDYCKELTSIEYFIDKSTTYNFIKNHIKSTYGINNLQLLKPLNYDPLEDVTVIIPKLFDTALPDTFIENTKSWKVKTDVLSLSELQFYYLSEYSMDALIKMRDENIKSLYSLVKHAIFEKSLGNIIYAEPTVKLLENLTLPTGNGIFIVGSSIDSAPVIYIANDKTGSIQNWNIKTMNLDNYPRYVEILNKTNTYILDPYIYQSNRLKIIGSHDIITILTVPSIKDIAISLGESFNDKIEHMNKELYYYFGYKVFNYVKIASMEHLNRLTGITDECNLKSMAMAIRFSKDGDNPAIEIQPCCYCKDYAIKMSIDDFIKSDLSNLHLDFSNKICDQTKKPCNKTSFKDCNNVINSISRACNLNCKMCAVVKSGICKSHKDAEIQRDTYFDVLDKLKNSGLFEGIQLTEQGEPFFYKEKTFDFIESLRNTSIKRLLAVTNTSTLTKEDIDRLSSYKEYIDIALMASLDSIYKSTYETIRKGSNFDKVMENILYANEKGLLERIIYVVQENNADELTDVEEFFSKKGLNNVHYVLDAFDKENRTYLLDCISSAGIQVSI